MNRGIENLPRDVAIYLVHRNNRETLARAGKHLGIDNYSTVSSAIERIKARMDNDNVLQKHLKKIEAKLSKSQRRLDAFNFINFLIKLSITSQLMREGRS